MKKLIVVLLFAFFAMVACNNNNTTASNQENQDTVQKPDNNAIADPSTDSAEHNANRNSMMSSMMKHMDQMKTMKSMNDPDHDFAMMMKHHHQSANEMAQVELTQGHHDEVKSLARQMIDNQNKEIQQIDNFLSNTPVDNKTGGDKFHHETMQMMNDMPMNMEHSGKDSDQQYVSMIISHHQQGIHMAQMYLKYGQKQEMKTLANKIIKEQEKEIKELKDMQVKTH